MNEQKEYFIYLLACFLSGEMPQGRAVDFEELYHLADIHDIGAIVATEIKLLEPAFQPTGKIASEFTQTIGITLREHTHRERAYQLVKGMLDSAAIPHLFVKGIVIKDGYPIPELRTSGDIDVIVQCENLKPLLDAIITESAITLTERTTETVTAVCNGSGAKIEFHLYADVGNDYYNDIFSLAVPDDGYTYRLDDYDHLLYIICHLAKHLAYRGAGIRMLMDIDVAVRKTEAFDEESLLTRCEQAHIRKTAEALLSLCNYWFHTPVTAKIDFTAETGLLEKFEQVMLDGGSFGYEQNAIPVSYLETDKDSVFSRVKVLLKMAFPSKEYLRLCYPYYHHHAWLYPVARVNRLLDGLFKKRKAATGAVKQMRHNSGASSAQLALLNELEIQYK